MKFILHSRHKELLGVETFTFKPEKPITWQAGQYIHYILSHDNPDNRGIERWFTVSAPPFSGLPSITTRYFGDQSSSFKEALFAMQIGEQIKADEPEGDFVLSETAKNHIFIAGGIGITPFRSMLAQLDYDQKMPKTTLLYANSDENIVFKEELASIASRNHNLEIKYYIDRHIAKNNLKSYFSLGSTVFYISGPRKMVEIYQNMLVDFGVGKENIKLDYFPGY